MKVVAISDTHNKHEGLIIPECDLLIHAGDFSSMGYLGEVKGFLEWFNKQPAEHKIFISGNHDFMDYEDPCLFKAILKEYPGVTYLRDEGAVINGVKIWGRPWTPEFYDWAFMKPRGSSAMRSTLEVIPSDTELLITHGPAAGILDKTIRNEEVGCEDLLNELERLEKLKVMVFGHIHHSSGVFEKNGVKHTNAAVLDDHYKMKFIPKTFDI